MGVGSFPPCVRRGRPPRPPPPQLRFTPTKAPWGGIPGLPRHAGCRPAVAPPSAPKSGEESQNPSPTPTRLPPPPTARVGSPSCPRARKPCTSGGWMVSRGDGYGRVLSSAQQSSPDSITHTRARARALARIDARARTHAQARARTHAHEPALLRRDILPRARARPGPSQGPEAGQRAGHGRGPGSAHRLRPGLRRRPGPHRQVQHLCRCGGRETAGRRAPAH